MFDDDNDLFICLKGRLGSLCSSSPDTELPGLYMNIL